MIEILGTQPLYCKSNRFAVIGTEEDVFWPKYSKVIDYELEMAAILWRSGKNMTPAEVKDRIFGYTIFNDFTARDTQAVDGRAGLGPLKSKDFDRSNALGPCIVTADAFDPYDCAMTVRVNGEVRSRGHSSTMTWTFEDALSLISQEETLYAGEVFGSGTVGGGSGLELERYLQDGDVIELEIEGIGVLRNQIRVNSAPNQP
ncbi:fumarylacetoacetate hydrolase family protein [Sphingobium sp. TKS]|uniref:fumarylacetoacetate hydrolase family protein n=2 Tax=unclassified Sphingobium TaxID=2611147 RepID=UPI0007700DCF|nr:fumarylacetoacetate hydrolase family protein [Sphingobium sp. TKS]AMK26534.1 fumarylacetoacetate (FAA) hydrolase [Sphingobium sp. TKS]